MTLAPIAVSGMILKIVPVKATDSTAGKITIVGVAYDRGDAGGSGIYQHGLQIQIASVTASDAGATIADPKVITATIHAAQNRVTCGGVAILREGDQTDVLTAEPSIPGPPQQSYVTEFRVKISSAGQTKVEAQ